MAIGLPAETAAVRINRYEKAVHDADLATAQRIADAMGMPLAYFYAETQVMAEAIVTFWLLNQTDQRKVLADLKKRVFTEPKKPAKGWAGAGIRRGAGAGGRAPWVLAPR